MGEGWGVGGGGGIKGLGRERGQTKKCGGGSRVLPLDVTLLIFEPKGAYFIKCSENTA